MSNDTITWPVAAARTSRWQRVLVAAKPSAALRRPLAAMLDQALVSGASFAMAVLLGRAAGAEQLGLYSLAATLLVLAAGVQESLVLIPYTVFAPQLGDERRRESAGSALAQSALVSVLFVVCLAVAVPTLAVTGSIPHLAPVLAVLLAAAPAILLRDFARRFSFAHLNVGAAIVIDATVAVLLLVALGGLASCGRLTALAAVALWGASCGLIALIWLLRSRAAFALRPAEFRLDWRRNGSLGGWLLAGHLAAISQTYTLHWLLALVQGVSATGDFAAVATIVAFANPIIIGLGNFLMPATAHTYAQSGADGVWRLALRISAWMGAVLGAFCLLVAFAGDWLMTLVYGERFGGQAGVVTLLALSASFAALGLGAEHGLRAMGRPRAIFLANMLALVVTLSLAAWLVPSQGTWGAAASLLMGNIIGCLARWFAFMSVSDRWSRQRVTPVEEQPIGSQAAPGGLVE
ncbi:MAG TPA: lipopolysaccharide biosynthesis protein [Pirellulales bacterium]|nr:lipopolysaccharide biosynthesis protein [Pirellulales bacterium]